MKRSMNYIYFLISFFILSACSRVCYLQEIDEFGNEINSDLSQTQNRYLNHQRVGGYERFQNFINGGNNLQAARNDTEQIFKTRFCNYMLGYREDDPKELVEMAKNISSSYKKMRMYDMASKFDSYQDVLIYGKETIPESWDDTTDLLKEFRRNIAMEKRREACRRKKLERENMSFWEKIFGKSKKQKSCEYINDGERSDAEYNSPTIIMAPPGCYSEQADYSNNYTKSSNCQSCRVGGQSNISAKTYTNPNVSTTLDGASDYF